MHNSTLIKHTIVSSPSEWLSTVPAWEGVRGEPGVDESEVGAV